MRPKPSSHKAAAERVVKDIRRATRKQYSAEDKTRIVFDGLCGRSSENVTKDGEIVLTGSNALTQSPIPEYGYVGTGDLAQQDV